MLPRLVFPSGLLGEGTSSCAWDAGRSPLPGGRSLPLVKCPDEGVRVVVSQKIRRLVQFERRLQQIMLRHFPARLFHQALKLQSLREQAPLEGPGAQAQFAGNVLQSGSLTRQKFLQDSLHLFPQGLVHTSWCSVSSASELRRHQFQQIRIVGQEGLGYVLAVKKQLVVPRGEFHGTPKMVLVEAPVCFRALQFHAQGIDATPEPPLGRWSLPTQNTRRSKRAAPPVRPAAT